MTKKIGFIVGSLREGSYNRTIGKAVAELLPEGYEAQFIEIGNLPFYNEDLDVDGKTPAEWTAFRDEVKEMTGIVFLTPEYNRSVPAVLKNALDVASRPYGQSAWDGKPALVVSVSIGAVSGFGANHHLRQSLVFLNMPTLAQPEAYIGGVTNLIDDQGNVIDNTKGFLKSIVDAYIPFLEANTK